MHDQLPMVEANAERVVPVLQVWPLPAAQACVEQAGQQHEGQGECGGCGLHSQPKRVPGA